MPECSEQGAGWLILLALCFMVYGVMAESLPGALEPEPEKVCQFWGSYEGRGPDGRARYDYKRGCWYGQ